MKKMIMFTSLITTLTAAGTVLAMTGSPVKAALTDKSDATLKIDTLDEVLELTSVPHFDFGEHSTSALSSGLTDHLGDNTSNELSVYHVTAETDNYVGWNLSLAASPFTSTTATPTKTLNANGSLKLSNTSNSPATDTALLPFKDDSVTIGGSGMIIAETADGTNPGRTTFKSNVAKGELSLKVLDVSGLTVGEEFTSTLDWTLSSNIDNPTPLP